MAANSTKIGDIEVLRAVAVLFVLYQHMGHLAPKHNWLIYHFGFWTGVDLFFAISGFVIARSLLRQPALPFPAVIEFWKRRAWRLLPSAWLWLVLMLAGAAWFNRSGAFGGVSADLRDTAAAVFQVANLHYYACGNLDLYQCGAAPHYWSLSVEEQFYIALPLLLLFARRWLVPVMLVVALVQIITPREGGYALANMVRSDALALGVLLAVAQGSRAYKELAPLALHAWPLRWPVVGGLVFLLAWLPGASIPQTTGAVALVSGLLVWIASYDRNFILGDGLVKQALVYIGSRSYGLYLVHIPIFLFVQEIFFRVGGGWLPLQVGLAAALVMVAGELNFRCVEAPLRAYGAKQREPRLLTTPAY